MGEIIKQIIFIKMEKNISSGNDTENGWDRTNTIHAAQTLKAYDTKKAKALRDGENFSTYKIEIDGIDYFPTACKQGPLQMNQISPPLTTDIVEGIQSSLQGIEMQDGRFDIDSGKFGNMSAYIRFPAVKDGVINGQEDLIPQTTWAMATARSLILDQQKNPNLTVGFQQRPIPKLNLGGQIQRPLDNPPLREYLRTIRPIWVPTGTDGDIFSDSCKYSCFEQKIFWYVFVAGVFRYTIQSDKHVPRADGISRSHRS